MRLTWLADVLRAAGVQVVEVDGWRTRGADSYGPVRGVIVHETRGSATSTDAGEINVLINGRVGLSGPIAQLYLSRTGVWHVVASGTCHHVKTGWGGPFSGLGNDSLLGIEAQHAESEDWARKPVQYASYVRGVAAILRHTGWPPPVGHREHQPGDKSDPEFDMNRFRADVAAAKDGGDMAFTADDERNIARAARLINALDGGFVAMAGGDSCNLTRRRIADEQWMSAMTVALKAIAERVDIDPAEFAAIEEAARRGAASAAVDVQALAAALAPLLGVDQAVVVEALESPAGQAALVAAANAAEDS